MFAFNNIVKNYENRFNKRGKIPENIDYDEYRIEDKIDCIKRLLYNRKSMSFNSFFDSASCKMELIVIFLAMLELIKVRLARVVQSENFGDIFIEGQEELWKTS
jgi:segregation and condensation protein A